MPKNFSDYTNLVLERMASNPEEFMHHSPRPRWISLVENLQDVARNPEENNARSFWALPKEEVDAMVEAYKHIYLRDMHKHMLHQILSGSDVTAEKQMTGTMLGRASTFVYKAKDRYSTAISCDPETYDIGQTVNDSPNYNRF